MSEWTSLREQSQDRCLACPVRRHHFVSMNTLQNEYFMLTISARSFWYYRTVVERLCIYVTARDFILNTRLTCFQSEHTFPLADSCEGATWVLSYRAGEMPAAVREARLVLDRSAILHTSFGLVLCLLDVACISHLCCADASSHLAVMGESESLRCDSLWSCGS